MTSIAIHNTRFIIASEESATVVAHPISVHWQEGPLVGHRGEDVVLKVEATGWPLPMYQWQRNGKDVPGANKPTLELRVQIAKSTEVKKYQCVHCRKSDAELPKNIYRCKCKNCGTLFEFPEQFEAYESNHGIESMNGSKEPLSKRFYKWPHIVSQTRLS